MSRKVWIILCAVIAVAAALAFFRFSTYGAELFSRMRDVESLLFPLVTISALIDSINPCALSILFVTVAFLMSLGRSRSNILLVGGIYVAGIYIAYFSIGVGFLQALDLFGVPNFVSKIAALILVAFGAINIINHYFPAFPIKLKIPDFTHNRIAKLLQKATLPAAFLIGLLVGVAEFPCTGGPYLLVLGLLHDGETFVRGLAYLVYYNFLFVLPLLVILFLASDKGLYSRVDTWRKSKNSKAKMSVSIIMVLLGLLLFAL